MAVAALDGVGSRVDGAADERVGALETRAPLPLYPGVDIANSEIKNNSRIICP